MRNRISIPESFLSRSTKLPQDLFSCLDTDKAYLARFEEVLIFLRSFQGSSHSLRSKTSSGDLGYERMSSFGEKNTVACVT